MPLIPELFFDGIRLQPAIVFCTKDEYENYMSNNGGLHDITNSNRISSVYFKEYLKSKNHDESLLIKKNERFAQSALNEEGFLQWQYAPTLTVKAIKEILAVCQLDKDEFFDAHCAHLKSL